jgi:CheY-like chemotaxis protein
LLRAQSEKFDLVITDMTMPQMTGEKLAEELTDIRIDIPIILCTGFSHGITDEKAKQIGIKGILMKPIIRAELAKIVRKVLDASKPHSQAELAAS